MKTEIKEIYKCDFCNKLYQVKTACEKHEIVCSKNPINDRPCFSCVNLCKKTTQIYGDYYDGSEWERNVELLFCTAKDTFLYPPKVESKNNSYELSDDSNEPMPKKCEIFDNQSFDLVSLFGC